MPNQRTQQRPPNYLGRKFQRRVMVMVGLLALVLVAMRYVKEPQAWSWLFQGKYRPEPESRIDNRLRPPADDTQIPGSFIARLELPDSDGSDGLFPGVNPGYLREVRDDSPFRAAENDAFFHLFKLLDETEQEQLNKASTGPVEYVQLYEQAAAYRGELVTVKGIVRAAWALQAPSLKFAPDHGLTGGLGVVTGMAATLGNEYGVEGYTEVWLQPLDKKDMVMVLYTLDLPAGFPTGENLREEVTATGFAFKRYAYGAPGTFRTTPMILTKTLDWTPAPPVAADEASSDLPLFLGLAGGMLVVCLTLVFFAFRKQRVGAAEHPAYVQKLLDRNKGMQDSDFSGIDKHDG